MKKLKIIIAMIAITGSAAGQPYGQTEYPNSSVMNSGCKTSINLPGFLMAGIKGSVFHIDRTNQGPLFNSVGTYPNVPFEKDYSIYTYQSCANNLTTGPANCLGVSAIELMPTPKGQWYAAACIVNGGVCLAFLHPDGSIHPGSTFMYPLPYNTTNVEKPVLV